GGVGGALGGGRLAQRGVGGCGGAGGYGRGRRGRGGRVQLELHREEEPRRHRLAAAGGGAEAQPPAPGQRRRVEGGVPAPLLDAHRVDRAVVGDEEAQRGLPLHLRVPELLGVLEGRLRELPRGGLGHRAPLAGGQQQRARE